MTGSLPILDLAFVQRATSGQLVSGTGSAVSGVSLCGVSIDSRSLVPGALFCAVVGQRMDGHAFLDDAVRAGAGALLVSSAPGADSEAMRRGVPVILVADTVAALARLAAAWRKSVAPVTIAITGSSGKTTVKEMLAACLRRRYRTHATSGNLNNHLGVPLTLLAMPADCERLVVELGMSAPGEITALAELARPSIGVVTNVLPAHLAHFPDGVTGIARAKGELVRSLPRDGWAVLPQDDPHFPVLAGSVDPVTPAALCCFGTTGQADVVAVAQPWHHGQREVILRWTGGDCAGEQLVATLSVPGEHTVRNAAAVAAAARLAGAAQGDIVAALAAFRPGQGRGRRVEASGGWTVLDETYNANPGSMRASLQALCDLAPPQHRVAILGDMLELGESSGALHAGLAGTIRACAIDRLLTVGHSMAALHACFHAQQPVGGQPRVVQHHDQTSAWRGQLVPLLQQGDVILVKGSRGMRMEQLVADLLGIDTT